MHDGSTFGVIVGQREGWGRKWRSCQVCGQMQPVMLAAARVTTDSGNETVGRRFDVVNARPRVLAESETIGRPIEIKSYTLTLETVSSWISPWPSRRPEVSMIDRPSRPLVSILFPSARLREP